MSKAIEEMAEKTLSKYNTEQLEAKLKAGKLIGASKAAALAIIEKRKQKQSANEVKEEEKSSDTEKVVKSEKSESKSEKVQKAEKPEKAEKTGKRGLKPRVALSDEQISQIKALVKEGKSVYAIRVQLELPYTTVKKVVSKD